MRDCVAADSTFVARVAKVIPKLAYQDVAIGDRFVVGREGP